MLPPCLLWLVSQLQSCNLYFYQSISNVKLINKIVVNSFHIIMHLNNKKQQFTYMTPEPLVIYLHCCILQAIVMAL